MPTPSNKFRFINRSTEDNSISLSEDPAGTKKCADVSLKFVPGQDVFLLQGSQIIKTVVDHIKIDMTIELSKYEANIVYTTKGGLEVRENELFAKMEELPVVDETKTKNPLDELDFEAIKEEEIEDDEDERKFIPKKPIRIRKNNNDGDELPF